MVTADIGLRIYDRWRRHTSRLSVVLKRRQMNQVFVVEGHQAIVSYVGPSLVIRFKWDIKPIPFVGRWEIDVGDIVVNEYQLVLLGN